MRGLRLREVKPLTGDHTALRWQGHRALLPVVQPSPAAALLGLGQPLSTGKWGELMTTGLWEGRCSVGGFGTQPLELGGSGFEPQLCYFCE